MANKKFICSNCKQYRVCSVQSWNNNFLFDKEENKKGYLCKPCKKKLIY